jgi:hypothetical protein
MDTLLERRERNTKFVGGTSLSFVTPCHYSDSLITPAYIHLGKDHSGQILILGSSHFEISKVTDHMLINLHYFFIDITERNPKKPVSVLLETKEAGRRLKGPSHRIYAPREYPAPLTYR